MKLVFNRQYICNAVNPLMGAVSNKSTLSATEGILIDAKDGVCTLTTYDMEKGIQLNVPAEIEEDGCFILNAQKFSQTVRVMEGDEISVTVTPNLQACIASGISTHRMNALNGKEFPNLPPFENEEEFEISQSVLKNMITKCMYAMGINDQRTVLNGCYFNIENNTLLTVSCDSYKMAKCIAKIDLVEKSNKEYVHSFIIPTKSVCELYKMLEDDEEKTVRVTKTLKNIVFHFEDKIFFARLIEGKYIDYNRIILTNHRITVTADRERFISALERAALVTEEKVAGSVKAHVKLVIEGNLLKISATSQLGETYDEVNIEHEGSDITIAFNNRFLIDSLRACSAEKVKISLTSSLTSINIEPAEEEKIEELFMLLPVRMKE